MKNILFIIDEIEYKYFEFNPLVTDFWLIRTFLEEGYSVDITTKHELFLVNGNPFALKYSVRTKNSGIFKSGLPEKQSLNDYKVIFVRPDPPVDIDFINATYVLDCVSKNVLCMNNPSSLRNINEKLYINKFPSLAPKNIVTSIPSLIKEFLFEYGEIIIKPLNKCFSTGVFYLSKTDKNINAIINAATNDGKTKVMVQEFLKGIEKGDKRLIFIGGEIFEQAVTKVATNNDFKFNEHKKENLISGDLTPAQKAIAPVISDVLLKDGIYTAGLDVIEDKIIEINITSPCFFINEINALYGIKFEKIIFDKLQKIIEASLLVKC
ncbi:MAG: hypothetical protein LUE64_00835 [Candidatus Gastranaerophilales bacterium]|nr:hypothetical protein [Candidatus Gastranaerophilales bacterium]